MGAPYLSVLDSPWTHDPSNQVANNNNHMHIYAKDCRNVVNQVITYSVLQKGLG